MIYLGCLVGGFTYLAFLKECSHIADRSIYELDTTTHLFCCICGIFWPVTLPALGLLWAVKMFIEED